MSIGYPSAWAGIAANSDVRTYHDLPVRTFAEAEHMIGELRRAIFAGRVGEHRRLWNDDYIITRAPRGNVKLRTDPNLPRGNGWPRWYALVLYDTEIVRYYRDGTFSVDNGGYNTPTTSTRVNQFTPDAWSFWHHDGVLCAVRHPEPDFTRYGVGLKRCDHSVRLPESPIDPSEPGAPGNDTPEERHDYVA